MRTIYIRLLIIILAIAVCIAIVYAVPPIQSIRDDDNQITVYSALPDDAVKGYLAAFEAEYPEIQVNLVNELTLALVNRLFAEQDTPNADVIWGLAVTSMLPVEWNRLLTFYAPTGIERIGPFFRDVNEPPQWVGIAARSVVFCINNDELAKRNLPTPQSWQDLIDPVYKGQMLILTPGQTSVGYLLMSTILQMYGDIEGWEYLAKLHQNADGRYASQAPGVCRRVRDAEYPIGITYDYRAYFPDDEMMSIVIPSEGTGWDLEVNALVHKEHIKPAAKIFLDWAISDSAMEQYARDRVITAAITEKDFIDNLSAEAIRSLLYDLDIPWIAANRERIQMEWMSLYGDNIESIDTTN